jgi:hypothetical protein
MARFIFGRSARSRKKSATSNAQQQSFSLLASLALAPSSVPPRANGSGLTFYGTDKSAGLNKKKRKKEKKEKERQRKKNRTQRGRAREMETMERFLRVRSQIRIREGANRASC